MCGIAGLILDELDLRGPAWLTGMTQQLFHRGPDTGGAVAFGLNGTPLVRRELGQPEDNVPWPRLPMETGLGARRLAIIDLSSTGYQPMPAQDGSLWIAFNGEIYNHEALRKELEGHGMVFAGTSDTEVFLAAYRVWGFDCFARLEGMWAAAIVDYGARQVVLSRDRLGIKPLYLARFEHGLAFASEVKAFLDLPGAAREVNEPRLRDFLVRGIVDHTDDTLFAGVWAAPAGCFIRFDLRTRGTMQTTGEARRFWKPRAGWHSLPDAAERVLSDLRGSVQAHLRSDVPVGSCLSGGLDSSSIVALVHRLAGSGGIARGQWSQHTFTASLPGSPLDETHHARQMVEACPGLCWHRVELAPTKLLMDLPRLLWHQEFPFGSPSIHMQYEVMRRARETGVTVLLDGQGGDELFSGYEGHWPPYLAHLLTCGRIRVLGRELSAAGFGKGAASLLAHVGGQLLSESRRDLWRLRRSRWRERWLTPALFNVEDAAPMASSLRLAGPEPREVLEQGPAVGRRWWSILLSESLPSLLRFEDRNSMAFSLEARVPLLDHRLVELAMSLPPELKLRESRSKVVLRDAVRGLVPDEIRDRRDKIGFSAPTMEWMRGELRSWWRDLIAAKSFKERGCFQPRGVERLAQRVENGDHSAALPLWRVAIVEEWARRFLDGRIES